MLVVLLYCALTVALCVILDRLWNKRTWDMLAKIPGSTPWPLIGNPAVMGIIGPKHINPLTLYFQGTEGEALLYSKENINVVWFGRSPIVLLSSPETVEPVISSSTALEKGALYRFMTPWLGDGLLLSKGDKWRTHRKLLTPSFHFRILDNFMVIMNEQSEVLIKKLKEGMKQADYLDPFKYYSKCTLDIICETAMGIRAEAQEKDSTYANMVHVVGYAITLRGSRPWLTFDSIFYLTKTGKKFKEAVNYLHDITQKVIDQRLSDAKMKKATPLEELLEQDDVCEGVGKKRLAFLDLLLESGFSGEGLQEQVNTFIFAGHDTTATALTWMSYLLGQYKDVQDKLIEEIDSIFGDDTERPVTKDDLKDLKYMDMVMKESQRVYPSVPGVSRNLDKDTLIGGYLVPKGVECFINTYSIHHNPSCYPNPEVFDPERFSQENSTGRHPYAFIPFSGGPRNCLGQRFALMEQKIVMCHILRNFRMKSLDQRDKLMLIPELVLKTDVPLRIQFIPRR